MPGNLAGHAQFAADALQRSRFEVDALMQKFQLRMADRQCAMSQLSRRIQNLIVMFTTCMWAAEQDDELVRMAAEVFCNEIRREHTSSRPTNDDFKLVTKLGARIAEGGFKAIAGVEPAEILQPYKK